MAKRGFRFTKANNATKIQSPIQGYAKKTFILFNRAVPCPVALSPLGFYFTSPFNKGAKSNSTGRMSAGTTGAKIARCK
jgi:hypothetical protein